MKKRKEKLKAVSVLVLCGLLLSGCGASGNAVKSSLKEEIAITEEAACDTAPAGGAFLSDGINGAVMESSGSQKMDGGESGGATAPEVQNLERKLIKNVNMEVETETFDSLLAAILEKTEASGGYIEESYTYNGSSYYGNSMRNASLSIRIPAKKLEAFLSAVSDVSNVISRNDSVTDVTLQYVDLDSHKKVLLAEQERLIALLNEAETIEDIISLESRLSEVRYQIESMESQLRTMDNQVSYSTVYLNINEVAKLTPVKEQSVGEKIATGFMGSLSDIGTGLADFGISVIINLPYILLWIFILLIVFLIVRLVLKFKVKRLGRTDNKEKKQSHSGEAAQDNSQDLGNPEEK